MVNLASLLTTLLFALGNLLGQNLGNQITDRSQYYGVFPGGELAFGKDAFLSRISVHMSPMVQQTASWLVLQ